MERRIFIRNVSLGGLLISSPFYSYLSGCKSLESNPDQFHELTSSLLADWCDGMLQQQIMNPEDLKEHGALGCPSCSFIHGRCMDAVYPFMYMADITGNKKYLEAAILVMNWAENNVSQVDGSWTVIPDPKSWRGITVFGVIALGEALHYHGHILEENLRNKWIKRLEKAAKFIFDNFSMTYSNVNYGFTAVYALNLLGKILAVQTYIERSRELAKEFKNYFTEPNKLIYGELKPIDGKSKRGLYGVDLGYNVEESLNGVVLYALEENDEELLAILIKSLTGHAEFMLPDGAWDNSWGTRQSKWSYWGSRTTDGCQMAFGMMAGRNPVFGKVAYKSTELLKQCTANGLLHGGPHYVSYGVKPCIHHTFSHAKTLAALLDAGSKLPEINKQAYLPREADYGVKEFPEISTWLGSQGHWSGTVTSYDVLYRKNEPVQQATGGALSVLYHNKVGLLFTASMARYMLVEVNNQQLNPGEEFALTPRVEVFDENNDWYTNLYDLEAKVAYSNVDDVICFEVETLIQNENRQKLEDDASRFNLKYEFSKEKVKIVAKPGAGNDTKGLTALVVPIVSQTGETIKQTSQQRIEIKKPGGTVILESNVPLIIKPTKKDRVFNLVPGVEAVPISANFHWEKSDKVILTLSIV